MPTLTTAIKIDTSYNTRLHAISGDIVGMGGNDLDRSLEGHEDSYELVRDFLVMQAKTTVDMLTVNVHEEARYDTEKERYQLGNKLIEAGIFTSKYDCRSEWILLQDG